MTDFVIYVGIGLTVSFIIGIAKTGVPGIGMLTIPLMLSVFPGKESAGALLPILIAGDLFALLWYRKRASWPRLIRLMPAVAVGMVGAGLTLLVINDAFFRVALGVLVLFLLALEFIRTRLRWDTLYKSAGFTLGTGAMAGFATTIGNAAGPIMNMYLLSQDMDKEEFMGTGAWYYFVVNCTKVPIYLWLGMINTRTLEFDGMVAPGIIVGAFLGRFILKKTRQRLFRALIMILTAIAAVRLLV